LGHGQNKDANGVYEIREVLIRIPAVGKDPCLFGDGTVKIHRERDVMVSTSSTRVGLGVLALAFVVSGCGVKRGQLDSDLNALRGEMRQGDEEVAARLGGQVDGMTGRVGNLEDRMQAFESALQSLRSEFDARIVQIEAAIRFDAPVHFGYDSADLREEDQPLLDRFASVVNQYYPSATVTVEGFTDPAGNADYNKWLGEERAKAVRQYLTETGGLDDTRVRAVSYGEASDRQIVPGAWGENGLANRRVALVIDYSGTPGDMLVTGSN
jgi:peptidoglycan-associated lipoprotein